MFGIYLENSNFKMIYNQNFIAYFKNWNIKLLLYEEKRTDNPENLVKS